MLDAITRSIERVIKLPSVCEILVTKEHIFATDTDQDGVVKMDKNGTIIESVGRFGNIRGQFSYPNGIRQSKEKEIYVCDSYNHRIQVFDEDLNFIRIIGEEGEMDPWLFQCTL